MNQTDNEFIKTRYKHITADELISRGLADAARKGGIVCPYCGNGSGEDGTGVEYNLLNNGYEGYCHRCHKHFDVFSIIAEREHLDCTTQFKEVFEVAQGIFGDAPVISKKRATPKKKEVRDFTAELEKFHADLNNFIDAQGGSYRGISREVLEKYHCGFSAAYPTRVNINGKWREVLAPRFIIPSSRHHYLARLIETDNLNNLPVAVREALERKSKQHAGIKSIFGLHEIPFDAEYIFVVEGEFDALSIVQSGFNAVAISGSMLSSHMLEEISGVARGKKFIVLLDNDDTGRAKAADNVKELRKLGFYATAAFLDGNYKDSNEFLQGDSQKFHENLQEIEDTARADFIKAQTEGLLSGGCTKDRINNCPLNLSIPRNIIFNTSGVYLKKRETDTQETAKCLSRTPIIPVGRIQAKNNSEELIKLAIYDNVTHLWRYVDVPHKNLTSRYISDLTDYGVSVQAQTTKYLADYLDDMLYIENNENIINRLPLHLQPGWVKDSDYNEYALPQGSEGEYETKNNGMNYKEMYRSRGDRDYYIDLHKRVYAKSIYYRTIFGAVMSAFALDIFGTRNGQILMQAPSGSGKSAITKLAFAAIGDPEEQRRTFNSTAKAADEIAARFNCLPMWVDEFQSAPKGFKEKYLEPFIYNYAEGRTRQRLSKDASLKPVFSFSGNRICTAEEPLLKNSGNQGAYARLIELKAEKVISDDLAREIHIEIPKHFGFFLKDWVEYIKEHKDEMREDYEKTLIDCLVCYPDSLPAQIQSLVANYIAGLHFMKMIGAENLECENEDTDTTCDVKNVGLCDIFYLALFILPTRNASTNANRAKNTIAEMTATHDDSFMHESLSYLNGAKTNEFGEPLNRFQKSRLSPTLGVKFCKRSDSGNWAANGKIAFYPSQFKARLENEAGFSSADAVIRSLAAENYLEVGNDPAHKFQKRVRIGDVTTWMYVFREGVLTD